MQNLDLFLENLINYVRKDKLKIWNPNDKVEIKSSDIDLICKNNEEIQIILKEKSSP